MQKFTKVKFKDIELAKHVKPLAGEADFPIWKRKMHDLLDYHEGGLEVVDNKLMKPEPIGTDAIQVQKKEERAFIYR